MAGLLGRRTRRDGVVRISTVPTTATAAAATATTIPTAAAFVTGTAGAGADTALAAVAEEARTPAGGQRRPTAAAAGAPQHGR